MHPDVDQMERRGESHPRMLEGISAAENDDLQRRANAVARRVFRRRIKAPAKTMADLRSALQKEGLVRVRIKRFSC
jgi:hypothetical protein